MKRILWPTDFSEPSYEAFKVAKEMALQFKAELYLVHIVTPLPPFAPAPKDKPSFDVSAISTVPIQIIRQTQIIRE